MGRASVMAISDGIQVGATLDRNGLRPSRYYVTSDDKVILASEVGVVGNVDPNLVIKKGRLEPGRMFLIDMEKGRIINDSELKEAIAKEEPYGEWLEENRINLSDLPTAPQNTRTTMRILKTDKKPLDSLLKISVFSFPQVQKNGKQPLGSMGNDAPLAVLSDQPQLIYNYFKQLFAQVTNPPIDPIREELVTASISFLGSEGDLTNPTASSCRMIKLESPLIDSAQLAQIKAVKESGFQVSSLPITFSVSDSEAINEDSLH